MENYKLFNAIEMNTIVETFIVEETMELIYSNEELDKWNNLVATLKLKGQEEIRTVDKSPIPFMFLKKTMVNIFKVLCASSIEVEKYNITTIPVEILDLIALSIRENYFQKIEIWYDENNPDPACVGVTAEFIPVKKGYTWCHDYKCKSSKEALEYLKSIGVEPYNEEGGYWSNQKYYLIGKWADVKHSFEELRKMASERFMESKSIQLKQQIKDAQRNLDDLETETFNMFN